MNIFGKAFALRGAISLTLGAILLAGLAAHGSAAGVQGSADELSTIVHQMDDSRTGSGALINRSRA
jgi:hypothetical protein